MQHNLVIQGKYPGLNDYIHELARSPMCGGRIKKNNQRDIEMQILCQLRKTEIKTPIKIHYTYFEENKRRDMDNVSGFFHKVFQDALTCTEKISDDGWKHIVGYSDAFCIDRNNPRIEIIIEEVEE